MSTYNLLRLVRNLRTERDRKIVYDNHVSSWTEIFENHPLKSDKNTKNFYSMEHSKEYWGDRVRGEQIIILRTAYTWGLLREIAKNSLKDCRTFYDVAQHTMLNQDGLLSKENHNWFKKALTAIYIAHPKAPKSLNYLKDLTDEQKEKAIIMSFQYYGIPSFERLIKLNKNFNFEKFEEKLLLSYWDVDGRESNLLDKILDKIKDEKKLSLDLNYIIFKMKPNNILKYQTVEINNKYIPLKDITMESKRWSCEDLKHVCLIDKEQEYVNLDVIFNLFSIQSLMKSLEPKDEFNTAKGVKFITGEDFQDIQSIFNKFIIFKEVRESMNVFIENNRNAAEKNKKKPAIDYWKQVESVVSKIILNEDLNTNKSNNKKIKI